MGQWLTVKDPGPVQAGCKSKFAVFREAADANDYKFNSISAIAHYDDRPPAPVTDYGPYDHKVYAGPNYAEMVTVPFVFPCDETCRYVEYEVIYSGSADPYKVRIDRLRVQAIVVSISNWTHTIGPVNGGAEDSPNRAVEASTTVGVSCPDCDPAATMPQAVVAYVAGTPAAQTVEITDITPPDTPYKMRMFRVRLQWPDVPPNANVGALEASGDCRCSRGGSVQPIPLPTWAV